MQYFDEDEFTGFIDVSLFYPSDDLYAKTLSPTIIFYVYDYGSIRKTIMYSDLYNIVTADEVICIISYYYNIDVLP